LNYSASHPSDFAEANKHDTRPTSSPRANCPSFGTVEVLAAKPARLRNYPAHHEADGDLERERAKEKEK
jgi:hypothetical protein